MKKLSLLSVMVLSLLITGCFWDKGPNNDTQKESPKVNEVPDKPLTDTVPKKINNIPTSEIDKRVAYCKSLPDEASQKACNDDTWGTVAMVNNDVEACKNILDTDRKASCLKDPLSAAPKPITKKNQCDTLKEPAKSSCIDIYHLNTAQKELDETLCDKISDTTEGKEMKTYCKENIKLLKKENTEVKK